MSFDKNKDKKNMMSWEKNIIYIIWVRDKNSNASFLIRSNTPQKNPDINKIIKDII